MKAADVYNEGLMKYLPLKDALIRRARRWPRIPPFGWGTQVLFHILLLVL